MTNNELITETLGPKTKTQLRQLGERLNILINNGGKIPEDWPNPEIPILWEAYQATQKPKAPSVATQPMPGLFGGK